MQGQSNPSSFFDDLRIRELNGLRVVRKRPDLGDLSSESGGVGAGVISVEHEGFSTPPTAISFCKTSRNSHLLAVSDEDGYVSFYDTRRSLPSYTYCRERADDIRVCDWLAHSNAIFDICWTKDDSQILTASGDQQIKVWNAETRKLIGVLAGHTGSVKTICAHSSNPDLVVSGSRDGSFALWDLRCKPDGSSKTPDEALFATDVVKDAHSSIRGKRVSPGKAASMSITSVLYLKDRISIATAGAVDSVVKFWDTRSLRSSVNEASPSSESSKGKPKETARHGITSLSQDSHGVSLTASCMDNRIYLYDLFHLDKGPVKVFSGSKIESFYVKSVISPDGAHILGGSSDDNVCIWEVKRPERLPVKLKGHECEVTAVDWCSSEVGKIATSSDDFMVRIWNIENGGYSRTRSRSRVAVRERVATPNMECIRLDFDESLGPVRERVATPNMECIRLDFDESLGPPSCSTASDDLHASTEAATGPTSPVQSKMIEFGIAHSGEKRNFGSYLGEEAELQRSPEVASISPSSVLNAPRSVPNTPSSVKRRTIRDYFLAYS